MWWNTKAALTVFTLFGVGALVYLLFLKGGPKDDISLKRPMKKIIELKVPKEKVGVIIGKAGHTLKDIEKKSNTKIKIVHDNEREESKTVIIKGEIGCAHLAECLILEVVNQPLMETYEMGVPAEACGRIMGKRGGNIKMISRNSKATLVMKRDETYPGSNERTLIIKGTAEQIALARSLVEQNLEEEKMCRNNSKAQAPNNSNQSPNLSTCDQSNQQLPETFNQEVVERTNCTGEP